MDEVLFFPEIILQERPAADSVGTGLFVDQDLHSAVLGPALTAGIVRHRSGAPEADGFHPVQRDVMLLVKMLHDGFGPFLA
jgi:hypothetical protein